MRKRSPLIIPIIIGVCVLALFIGYNAINRNTPGTDRNNTTRQGRNILGEDLDGSDPNAGPNVGNTQGGNNNAGSGNNPPDPTRLGTTPAPGNNTGLNRMVPQAPQQNTGFDTQRADNIRNQLGNMDGIGPINTVVNGNTALIGYNRTNTARDANATRKIVTDRVKQIDTNITNVVVGDTGAVSSRIGRLADNVRNNRPVKGLSDEFNRIIQSIRPG